MSYIRDLTVDQTDLKLQTLLDFSNEEIFTQVAWNY